VRPEELPERVASILGKLKDAEREISAMRRQQCWQRRPHWPLARATCSA
jgi:hypothetical protein